MTRKEKICKEIESIIEVRYATNNRCYQSGSTINPDGSVTHSIGVAQPSVDVMFNAMNTSSAGWGVNILMNNERIVLVMPWNRRPWGCGSGSRGSYNNTKFQFEICEPAGHTYAGGTMIGYDVAKNQKWFDGMWDLLVKLHVYLCVKFGNTSAGMVDHAESYRQGYGSNHADVGHWLPKHGKSMTILRNEVQAILDDNTDVDKKEPEYPVPDNTPDSWAKDAVDNAVRLGLLLGDDTGNYMLHKECSRQEMVVFLYRIYNKLI